MRRKDEEHKLQTGCVTWYRLQYSKLAKALYSIPNGGERTDAQRRYLVEEGLVAGATDLVLAVPNRYNAGLYIEMKTPTGVVRKEQKEFLTLMKSLGYAVEVVRTFDRFVEVVNRQMRNR